MNMYETPSRSRRSTMRRKMPARAETSSIDTGSSATIGSGPRTIAEAMATRCRWPPESGGVDRCESLRRPEVGEVAGFEDFHSRLFRRLAASVNNEGLDHRFVNGLAGVERSEGVLKDHLYAPAGLSKLPPVQIRQIFTAGNDGAEVGTTNRITAIAMVEFPQPDSPTRASISPRAMLKETPSTALTTSPCRPGK